MAEQYGGKISDHQETSNDNHFPPRSSSIKHHKIRGNSPNKQDDILRDDSSIKQDKNSRSGSLIKQKKFPLNGSPIKQDKIPQVFFAASEDQIPAKIKQNRISRADSQTKQAEIPLYDSAVICQGISSTKQNKTPNKQGQIGLNVSSMEQNGIALGGSSIKQKKFLRGDPSVKQNKNHQNRSSIKQDEFSGYYSSIQQNSRGELNPSNEPNSNNGFETSDTDLSSQYNQVQLESNPFSILGFVQKYLESGGNIDPPELPWNGPLRSTHLQYPKDNIQLRSQETPKIHNQKGKRQAKKQSEPHNAHFTQKQYEGASALPTHPPYNKRAGQWQSQASYAQPTRQQFQSPLVELYQQQVKERGSHQMLRQPQNGSTQSTRQQFQNECAQSIKQPQSYKQQSKHQPNQHMPQQKQHAVDKHKQQQTQHRPSEHWQQQNQSGRGQHTQKQNQDKPNKHMQQENQNGRGQHMQRQSQNATIQPAKLIEPYLETSKRFPTHEMLQQLPNGQHKELTSNFEHRPSQPIFFEEVLALVLKVVHQSSELLIPLSILNSAMIKCIDQHYLSLKDKHEFWGIVQAMLTDLKNQYSPGLSKEIVSPPEILAWGDLNVARDRFGRCQENAPTFIPDLSGRRFWATFFQKIVIGLQKKIQDKMQEMYINGGYVQRICSYEEQKFVDPCLSSTSELVHNVPDQEECEQLQTGDTSAISATISQDFNIINTVSSKGAQEQGEEKGAFGTIGLLSEKSSEAFSDTEHGEKQKALEQQCQCQQISKLHVVYRQPAGDTVDVISDPPGCQKITFNYKTGYKVFFETTSDGYANVFIRQPSGYTDIISTGPSRQADIFFKRPFEDMKDFCPQHPSGSDSQVKSFLRRRAWSLTDKFDMKW